MTRMTQEQAEEHQRRVWSEAEKAFHVEPRWPRRRPRPNTVLISEAATKKKSKFKNIRCQAADGTNFASRSEMRYYEQLLLRWKAGDVLWFVLQPSFRLEGGVVYRADFLVVSRQIARMDFPVVVDVIDCKGFQTRESKNKLRQLKSRYGIDVQLVRKIS